MHPLIPDEFSFRRLQDDGTLQERTLPEIGALHVRERLAELSMSDALYSFGTSHPGAITLHNFPRFLQHFDRADGSLVDLASIDVLRVRERGVPRYNQFRRLLHLSVPQSFEELTDNPVWARELSELYDGDIEKVDLQIGMHAETPPPGFGFSDTAFRVFILMASRRLKSDRFLTDCYTEEYYTRAGLQWIADSDMRTVLLRHFPLLARSLDGVGNAFTPWRTAPPPAPAGRATV
jgi:hypothetical protein